MLEEEDRREEELDESDENLRQERMEESDEPGDAEWPTEGSPHQGEEGTQPV